MSSLSTTRARHTEGCCPSCGQSLPDDDLYFDRKSRMLVAGGKSVRLRPSETELVYLLWKHTPNFVSKDQIIFWLWQERDIPENADNLVSVYIHRLRKVLKDSPWLIDTLYGEGYALKKIPGLTIVSG